MTILPRPADGASGPDLNREIGPNLHDPFNRRQPWSAYAADVLEWPEAVDPLRSAFPAYEHADLDDHLRAAKQAGARLEEALEAARSRHRAADSTLRKQAEARAARDDLLLTKWLDVVVERSETEREIETLAEATESDAKARIDAARARAAELKAVARLLVPTAQAMTADPASATDHDHQTVSPSHRVTPIHRHRVAV